MQHPSLTVSRSGIDVRKAPVHVPFYILHISLIQNAADFLINIIHHFFSGKIKYQLMSGTVRPAARDDKCPIRMLPVKITVFIHHLRFNPDAEFQAHVIDFPDQPAKSTAQFLFVYRPVSQTSELAVSLSEPAVVHDKHLHAQLSRLLRQSQKGLAGKVKIGSFPAVQKNRTHNFLIFPSAQVGSHTAVQILGKFCQTFGRITHHHFRRLKFFARIQRISKLLLAESHQQPCLIILILARFALKASTVYKNHGIAASRVFCGIMLCHNHSRIVLVA